MMPNHSPKVNKQLLEKVKISKFFNLLMASKWPVMIPKHIPNTPKQFWKKVKIEKCWAICHLNISCLIISCVILWYDMISYDIIWYHMISYDSRGCAEATTSSNNGKPNFFREFWLWKMTLFKNMINIKIL